MHDGAAATTPILISGAGYAGLVVACELARRGVAFRIIDRERLPADHRSGSRGKGIQPRTLEVYDDLGVIEDVMAQGGPYPPAMSWDGSKQLGLTNFQRIKINEKTPDVPYPSMWMLPQPKALAVLRGRLSSLGHQVEFGTKLVSFQDREGGVLATLERQDGTTETFHARYLVGADGARGQARAGSGVEFASDTLDPHPMITADVVIEGLERTHWHMWDGAPGGALWLGPLVQSDAFQLYAKFDDADPDLSFEALSKLIRNRTGRDDLILREVHYASLFGSRVGMARHFRIGRTFLVGDAAHIHPPAGGQGMNTSVQDAYNLAWKLAQVILCGANDRLLDTYEEERLPVAANLLSFVGQLHKDWLGKGRDKEEPRVGEHSQLTLNYRNRTLSRDYRGEGLPDSLIRAGDRAPDAPLADQSSLKRLFDLFRGPHFTLLSIGCEPPHIPSYASSGVRSYKIVPPSDASAGPATLRDCDGYVARNYGSGVILVRPDGYVGYAGDCTSPGLNDYLAELFGQSGSHS